MNAIDRLIGFISPKSGFKRVQARAQMLAMENQIRKYEGAAEGRRHAGWRERNNPSVNQLINKDLKNLVARSRELNINNSYAKKAPVLIANNVVGTGIMPTPVTTKTDNNGFENLVVSSDQITTLIKSAWKYWGETQHCDYNGDCSFYGIQYLAMRTIIVSGEVLIIKKRVITDINKLGLQLQMLEGDYIDNSKNNDKDPDGGYTLYGIKFNKDFKKAGYWIFDRHPSEGNAKSQLIPIADIIHVYDLERAGQTRGVPAASSTLLKQRDLDDYEDAELLGKKASACMPIFVTDNSVEGANEKREEVETIEPGMIQYLNPGESITFASPPANNGFSEFTKTQHRSIASGYLMTYEALTGDLSNVNFSSGRMGMLDFNRQVEYWQYLMLIPKLCDKVYEWFIENMRIISNIPEDMNITASWTAPRRQMIDPAKEITAMKTEVRAGFNSWSEVVKANGYNPDEIITQLSEDQKKFEKAGLMPEWSAFFENKAAIEMLKAKTPNVQPIKE